jgi:hypothetical protein
MDTVGAKHDLQLSLNVQCMCSKQTFSPFDSTGRNIHKERDLRGLFFLKGLFLDVNRTAAEGNAH